MKKSRYSSTREEAVADLRVGFAGFYNEMRRRGHEVIVAYEDPGNPLYIPRVVEVDGLLSNELNVRFFIEPCFEGDALGYIGYHWGIVYLPTLTARNSYCERKKERSQRLSKNQLSGASLAEWVEKLLDVEQRAKRLVRAGHDMRSVRS